MSENRTGKRTVRFQIFSACVLLICLLGTVYFFRARYRNTLTSDEASELVLGNMLASEGGILSKNWYYSAEIRVLNINIPYAFFFHFTNSWHRVRLLTTLSLYILLLLSYYGMSRIYHFRNYYALSAAVFFIPFSEVYSYITLKGIHYLPFLIISFLILSLAEWYVNHSGKKAATLLIISFLFSVIVGLGGARQLLVTFIPLIMAACIMALDKTKKPEFRRWLVYAVIVFLGCVIGFLINAIVLSKIYTFSTWSYVAFTGISFDRIGDLISRFLVAFGYRKDSVFSIALLCNFLALAWFFLTFLAVCYAVKNRQKVSGSFLRLAVFTLCVYVVFIAFYVFTDAYYHERYNLPVIVLSFPLIALFLEQVEWKRYISRALLSVMVMLTAVSGFVYYRSLWFIDSNEELREIADFLVDEGYQNGYSSFWRSNILTEFSNGRLDIWSIVSDSLDTAFLYVTDIDQTFQYLQQARHDSTHPEGKLFLLFTSGEYENNIWKENLKEDSIIYRSPDYVILGYDNYDSMIDELYPGYVFSFYDDQWIENGRDVNGHRELYVGGVSYGPYKTLWPGYHQVIIKGSGLNNAQVFCIGENGAKVIEPVIEEQNDSEIWYGFTVSEKTYNVETLVRNMSDVPGSVVRIDSMSIQRISQNE